MRNALRSSILFGIWLCSGSSHADAPDVPNAAADAPNAAAPDALNAAAPDALNAAAPDALNAAALNAPKMTKATAPSKNAEHEPSGATKQSAPSTKSERPPAVNETASSDPVADLYNKAQNRYLEGDVEAALQLMEQCYELSHRPNLLYNLAQIYRELGQCEPALKNYQQYLKESPNGERRDAAEQYVGELVKQCPPKESNAASAPTAALAPSQPSQGSAPSEPVAPSVRVIPLQVTPGDRTTYWTPARQGGWTLTAIGVAAAVGSVYFAFQARDAKLDAEQILRDAKADPTRTVWADRGGNAREDDFRRARTLAIGFGGVSVAALGAGVAALVLAPSTSASTHSHLSLTVAPSVLGGGYCWQF